MAGAFKQHNPPATRTITDWIEIIAAAEAATEFLFVSDMRVVEGVE